MTVIPVRLSPEARLNAPQNINFDTDWVIVELQGVVSSKAPELDGLTAGMLAFDDKGNPNLTIGQQMLVGKVTPLKTPIAVMRRKTSTTDAAHSQTSDTPQNNDNNAMQIEPPSHPQPSPQHPAASTSTEYEIAAIVHHKLLFKTRPKNLLSESSREKLTS
ncbi:hypothetical protein CAOG_06792 [Capsaspora owczarzaki ATCC 30864]|uniref:Chromosome transmission fidelity protein 8 n=1 Tax=Capsaspora owczarzaki (strain ATCC 30864) TaxID=595528 RepID=A0A0D2WVV9_CAPO3|nr:hypothetical protein CAOG_06792 [Capsaspora owczarzaki ATCC 30864]KJE96468.1 hypothetical protein CAOG_006792 [Capsaspora owczarzaki ATCC 30864]|eukprot:XP_004344413.2 hypothetical protein CAOG_06792 [Capsaspora owczarzaki ATCC 30864]